MLSGRRWLPAVLALMVLGSFPLLAIEALYRWGRLSAGELPRLDAEPLQPAHLALWVAFEGSAPMEPTPIWPWTVVGVVSGGTAPVGARVADSVARMHLASRGMSRPGFSIARASLAIALSRNYRPDHLLSWLADRIWFGRGAVGLRAAALAYFDVPPEMLAPAQYALLGALAQSPSRYDPSCRPDAALRGRARVLGDLAHAGFISEAQRAEADASPLRVVAAGCRRQPGR